jgi:cytidine deaminase
VKASIDQRPRPRRPVRAARQGAAGNPYDGHTLGAVIEATEGLTGCEIERAYVDKGYRARDTTIRAASSSLARSAARTAAYGSHPSSHVFSAASCPPMRQQRESQK